MGLQLIICVETDSKSKSDFMYIRSLLNEFYVIDPSNTKLSPVFMGGKSRYASKKIQERIAELTKQYNHSSDNSQTEVLFCFDCDEYDRRPEDKVFLQEAEKYCVTKGYRFVWFCRDIEDVFWNKPVPDTQKKTEATRFVGKKQISKISIKRFKETEYRRHSSNLCLVLNDYLELKQ